MPQQFASPTLSPFTAADGENLALHEWPVAADTPLRGLVVLVHGLGEHAGRYGAVAEQLNTWGFAVRGYDHYGHGESAGPRGGLSSDTRLLDDLADMIECTRARLPPGLPLVLLGHSMGGLVAARLVSLNLCPVDALVLSSPALDAGLSPVQKLLVSTLPSIAPNLRVGNVAAAPTWAVPTLLMWAGADRLVSPAGSQAFAQAAPPAVVQSHCFENAFHELFNETPEYATPVFDTLRDWLLARFAVRY